MKIRSLWLLVVSVVVLTGCARSINMSGLTVKPASYDKHPALYEVAYDLDCVAGGATFQFRKGQRFLPKDFSGAKVTVDDKWKGFPVFELPKHSIGLIIHEGGLDTKTYAVIYPNGHFVSEEHFVDWRGEATFYFTMKNHKLMRSAWSKNICKLKNGKPLFKKITNK